MPHLNLPEIQISRPVSANQPFYLLGAMLFTRPARWETRTPAPFPRTDRTGNISPQEELNDGTDSGIPERLFNLGKGKALAGPSERSEGWFLLGHDRPDPGIRFAFVSPLGIPAGAAVPAAASAHPHSHTHLTELCSPQKSHWTY